MQSGGVHQNISQYSKKPQQGPRRHFESGWANTSEFFEKKILKGPLFSKFSKSGWAMAHMAHPPTRALLQWLLYCFRFPTWNLFFIYNCWKNKEVLFFDQSRSSLIQIIKRISGNFLWFLAYQSGKMFFAWSGKGFDISSVLNSIVFLLNDWDIIMMDFSLETIICWCSILIWRVLQSPYGMFFAVQCQHSLVATLVFFCV